MRDSRCTVNIHTGKKLSGKSRDEILEAIVKIYQDKFEIIAVQQNFDMIRVTFKSEAEAVDALKEKGIRLFGLWCRIDGGPPTTIIHLFDYPHEEDNDQIHELFETYGLVKNVRRQKYISHPDIFTGTRLVDIILDKAPPRMVSINSYICRTWYRGQPLICNLCGTQGHKSANCPNKDKCRLCGKEGHMARSCPNPWGPPRRFPIRDGDCGTAPANTDGDSGQVDAGVDNTPAPEQATTSFDNAPVPNTSEQQAPGDSAASQDSVADDVLLNAVDPASHEASPSGVASGSLNESSDSASILAKGSQEIGEFSSSQSLADSQPISDFSEESQSQSILRDVRIEVVDSGSVARTDCPAGSLSLEEISDAVLASSSDRASLADSVEEMDSSVCRKRKDRPDPDPSGGRRSSRSKSSEPVKRRPRTTVSCSPSPSRRGVHVRLPLVANPRPSRV